jgi:CSLREA domain-containing protein
MSSPMTRLRTLAVLSCRPQLFWIQLILPVGTMALSFIPALTRVIARSPATANATTTKRETPNLARLSESVNVRAAGRGNPTIKLSDGREVLTAYVGSPELQEALEQNKAQPLSLASADFDEDGVPDLISGYQYNGRGIVTLLRGNVDSIYPNAPEAQQRRASGTLTNAPFLSPARVFEAPIAADFIGAGDFDGDSHWDVVVASRRKDVLYLLSGDGRGGLGVPKKIQLPGVVTALVTGEINRRDGLTDVIVGVNGPEGPQALVFEGPEGALRNKPEILPLPDAAASLALGNLDDDYTLDLAVAAGNDLLVVHGRDRKLSLDEDMQRKVQPANVEQRPFPFAIKSVAIGDFSGSQQSEIALLGEDGAVQVLSRHQRTEQSQEGVGRAKGIQRLSTWRSRKLSPAGAQSPTSIMRVRMSGLPADDLVLIAPEDNQLRILNGTQPQFHLPVSQQPIDGERSERLLSTLETSGSAPDAILPMRLNVDALDDLVILNSGFASPAVCLTSAEGFVSVPSPLHSLPTSSEAVAFNYVTKEAESGAVVSPMARLADPLAYGGQYVSSDTADTGTAGNSVVAPTTGNYVIWCRVLAPNPSTDSFFVSANGGAEDIYDVAEGTWSNSWQWTRVNGRAGGAPLTLNPRTFNLTQGSNSIVFRARDANTKLDRIIVTDDLNFVPSDTPQTFTVNSANDTDDGICNAANCTLREAINAANGNPSADLINFAIGTGVKTINLLSALPKITDTVTIDGTTQPGFAGTPLIELNGSGAGFSVGLEIIATNCVIRGLVINRFSSYGIFIKGDSNIIEGNFVGTNITGTSQLDNFIGIELMPNGDFRFPQFNCRLNTIGGTTPAARNVIIDSVTFEPISSTRGASGNTVVGNFIDTDVTGTVKLANGTPSSGRAGVISDQSSNTVGGTTAGARNIIAEGVIFGQAFGSLLQGNYIGTDVSGTIALNGSGVYVAVTSAFIGGTISAARNVISGNTGAGITIDSLSFDASMQGNYIGTNASGTGPLGNTIGIQFNVRCLSSQGCTDASVIGGAVSSAGNVISGNSGSGIYLQGAIIPIVQNNLIGIDATGAQPMGNSRDGILVQFGTSNGIIKDNNIAYNGGNGVNIPNAPDPNATGENVQNLIQGNSIFANSALGINLGPDGITPNDPLDPDTGANLLQNFPVLSSFSPSSPIPPPAGSKERFDLSGRDAPMRTESMITVSGTLNSTPNTTFIIQWYFSADAQCTNNQQGSRPLAFGRIPGIATDANGNAPFSFPFDFPPGLTSGVINTTATDPNGNTSEFSACMQVVAPTYSIGGQVAGGGSGLTNVKVTLSGTSSGSTSTDTSGNYSFTGLTAGGNYTVTPTDTSLYSFTAQSLNNLSGNQTANFTGALRSYSISGQVTSSSAGLIGVTVSLTGPSGFPTETFTTQSDGNYTFTGVPAGSSYTVTPSKANYTFSPTSAPINNLTADQSANFTATVKSIQFDSSGYIVSEGAGSAIITVTRSGDASGPASVDYATSDGSATQAKDYIVASETLSFAATETSKTFNVLIVDDAFVEANETINLTLSNPTGATLSAPTTAAITIADNDTANATSPTSKRFACSLNGAQETPPNNSPAKGTGLVLLNQGETSALVGLLFQNLGSAETAAHVHGNGGPGVMAPILFPLPTTNPVINFTINPTAQQVADLKAGLHYQNVHSANFANGEIRGQLLWNPTLEENFLIRQQYLDFLSRDGDPGGYNFWVGTITPCQADAQCFHDRTIAAADAFFFEPEFQQTAGFVFRAYRGAYGNTQPFPNPDSSNPAEANKLVDYSVYVADRARVVGGANLAAAQQAFANLFVSRPEFTNRYGAGLTAAQFVDAILATMQTADGVNLTAQRQALIDQYNNAGGGNAGRGMVLYRLADDNVQSNPINNRAFIDAEYNRQFALTLYFGYLRRNPDIGGFLFWQSQINSAPIRDVPKQNALVCSFVTAAEYQFRFGPSAPRSNDECPH